MGEKCRPLPSAPPLYPPLPPTAPPAPSLSNLNRLLQSILRCLEGIESQLKAKEVSEDQSTLQRKLLKEKEGARDQSSFQRGFLKEKEVTEDHFIQNKRGTPPLPFADPPAPVRPTRWGEMMRDAILEGQWGAAASIVCPVVQENGAASWKPHDWKILQQARNTVSQYGGKCEATRPIVS